jgi:hypothetical protein
MKIKIVVSLVIPLLLLQACLKNPDPIPETIDTYHFYYNYLLEPYDVQWEIDDEIIGVGHSYGITASAISSLNHVEQEVLIQTRDSQSGLFIDSLSHTMIENGAYLIAMLGTEEEPHLMCEPMDTGRPATGMLKFRFLYTSPVLGLVDIYIGGDMAENKVLSGVEYASVTEYAEATEGDMWEAIIVTPANILPVDSTILSYTANTIFRTGWSYLCIIGHSDNSIESSYQIQVDAQPLY